MSKLVVKTGRLGMFWPRLLIERAGESSGPTVVDIFPRRDIIRFIVWSKLFDFDVQLNWLISTSDIQALNREGYVRAARGRRRW